MNQWFAGVYISERNNFCPIFVQRGQFLLMLSNINFAVWAAHLAAWHRQRGGRFTGLLPGLSRTIAKWRSFPDCSYRACRSQEKALGTVRACIHARASTCALGGTAYVEAVGIVSTASPAPTRFACSPVRLSCTACSRASSCVVKPRADVLFGNNISNKLGLVLEAISRCLMAIKVAP